MSLFCLAYGVKPVSYNPINLWYIRMAKVFLKSYPFSFIGLYRSGSLSNGKSFISIGRLINEDYQCLYKMCVETGLSPALALKSVYAGKNA